MGKKAIQGVLDPVERISEILFGLIMVLTCTGSLSVSGYDHGEVRTMLIGALGCNLAWGIIDAFMYLMGCFSENGRVLLMLRASRQGSDPGKAHNLIADALPPVLASVLQPSEIENMRRKLEALPEPPARPRLKKRDWVGALGVFMMVFLSTLPVVIPFGFVREVRLALRISNAIALIMLFLSGYAFGHYSGHRRWTSGLFMVLVGIGFVGITMALGG
jgi:hypothetical protein